MTRQCALVVLLALGGGNLGCNEDTGLSTTLDNGDGGEGDGGASDVTGCASQGTVGSCLSLDGCTWINQGTDYRCFLTVCMASCSTLGRSSCLSCFGCDWVGEMAGCGDSNAQAGQSSCGAATSSDFCRSRSDCAWITTIDGSQCVEGNEGPHS